MLKLNLQIYAQKFCLSKPVGESSVYFKIIKGYDAHEDTLVILFDGIQDR